MRFRILAISRRTLLGMRNVSNKIVEKLKHTFYVQCLFLWKSFRLLNNVEKCGGAREAAENMVHGRSMLDK